VLDRGPDAEDGPYMAIEHVWSIWTSRRKPHGRNEFLQAMKVTPEKYEPRLINSTLVVMEHFQASRYHGKML
jgi:hypothetical protein